MRSLLNRSAEPAPVVDTPRGWQGLSGGTKLGVATAVMLAAVGAIVLPDMLSKPKVEEKAKDQHQASNISDYQPPDPIRAAFGNHIAPDTTTGTVAAPRFKRATPTEMALYSTPVVQRQETASAGTDQTPAGTGGDGGSRRLGGVDPNDRLAASLVGTTLPTSRATVVRNRSFIIRAGASIPCNAVEAINSARPGFVSCLLSQPFRSDDGRRMLLPPGTRIFGQLKSGLQQNERRLGVLFTLIETPWFDQPLQAPGGDALGRSGLDGDVDTFFWDRAAAVGLYALMDAGIGAGQNLASSSLSRAMGSGNGTTLNFGSQSQGLASQQFGATINRPPELTRPEGMPLSVSVGQTLDFSDACKQAMQVDDMACPLL